MKSKSNLKLEDEKPNIKDNVVLYEDKVVWFIWIGLIFLAVATLPFIARSPNLVGFITDLCLAIIP